MLDGEATGNGELSQQVEVHGVIYRQEIGSSYRSLTGKRRGIGQVYQCIDPTVKYG
ncbi:hypothetical protein OK016_24110 [Vibrio chagasii]|nr:hypothetical protein [Vibrio chagasii]